MKSARLDDVYDGVVGEQALEMDQNLTFLSFYQWFFIRECINKNINEEEITTFYTFKMFTLTAMCVTLRAEPPFVFFINRASKRKALQARCMWVYKWIPSLWNPTTLLGSKQDIHQKRGKDTAIYMYNE